jgi:hypothetical protein
MHEIAKENRATLQLRNCLHVEFMESVMGYMKGFFYLCVAPAGQIDDTAPPRGRHLITYGVFGS